MDEKASKKNPPFTFEISVRDLVDFVFRRGDLSSGPSFTSPRRALRGTRGHQKLQASRPENYRAEVALNWRIELPDFHLLIRGRIDGVREEPDAIFLEEIKTVTGQWKIKPSKLHWAQLKIYGGIWNRLNPPKEQHLQLTYYDLETETEHHFEETHDGPASESFLQEALNVYLDWLQKHVDRCVARNCSIESLKFPFSTPRKGQDEMIESISHLNQEGGAIMVEAPTGIGKTMASLFPSIKALHKNQVRQLMIVLARTPGQSVFKEALNLLQKKGLKIKTLSLLARDKVCQTEGKTCDLANCKKRLGYFDRLPAARSAAIQDAPDLLDAAALNRLGDEHQICPHALAINLVPWVDIILGDYNYAFDPGAQLSCFFGEEAPRRSRLALLIDEAHNLVDRAREMHSQQIRTENWSPSVKWLHRNQPKAAAILRELWKVMMAMFNERQGDENLRPTIHQAELFADAKPKPAPNKESEATELITRISFNEILLQQIPESWQSLMEQFLELAEDLLNESTDLPIHAELLGLYFEIHGFMKAVLGDGENHRIILKRLHRHIVLHRYCVDPSKDLSVIWRKAWSALFFSATLSPAHFYQTLFDVNKNSDNLKLEPPFDADQWQVIVHQGISTTYRNRAMSYDKIAELIHITALAKQGNYLIFFPSYEYLRSVKESILEILEKNSYQLALLVQTPEMNEKDRREYLAAFQKKGQQTQIGLAVMGGIFGEGIDLVGEALIGVVVVGVGLPQVCLERNLIRKHFESQGYDGFDFAYRYPGFNRVMQAVGRLIRTHSDHGLAVIIDQRFRQQTYSQLLPKHWPVKNVQNTIQFQSTVDGFWNEQLNS